MAETPMFSLPEGFYDKPIVLALSTKSGNAEIHYTLDGSTPTRKSRRYTKPLKLKKTAVVRARHFRDLQKPNVVATGTYFIGEEEHLPVLSLAIDPDNLWHPETGIYRNSTRRGIKWERPVSVTFFKKDGTLGVKLNAGLRIHGGMSRQRSTKQSFRLYFRSEYGANALEYPIIPSAKKGIQFKKIVLRGGYNDSWRHWGESQRKRAIYVRDQLVRDLHLDMGCIASHGDFVSLYLNGKYWGLYNVCERIDADFLASYFGHADWDIIKDGKVKSGDRAAWRRFRGWYYSVDLAQKANYEAIQKMLDLDNFTDYVIVNVWTQNYDWPSHNWYAARKRGVEDARWIFLTWDAEYAFGAGMQPYQVNHNTLAFASSPRQGPLGMLLCKLLKNADYRLYFTKRLTEHLAGALDAKRVLARLEARLSQVRPTIPAEAKRWQRSRGLSDWERAVRQTRHFIARRTPHVQRYVTSLRARTPKRRR